jgi:hypothetical protein
MLAFARFAAILMTMLAMAGTASAATVAPADQAAIHTVIQTQLEAFKRDDYDAAYAVAAPAIKVLYPSSQEFALLVKSRYSQLIRPQSVAFGAVMPTDQGPVQRVFITAADGRAYVATYSLQQQPDNSWLIAGCSIARDHDSSAI